MKPNEVPWYEQEDVVSTYETWYEGRYKKAELQEKHALERGIDWIGGVNSLLEVGCGTGHFTRWFQEREIDAHGVDISPFMLRQAKALWRGDRLVRATSSGIPFKPKSFDAVGFITCFEYMPEPVQVISEAIRTARRGIFFGLMNSWSVPTLRRKIQLALGKNPYYKTAHFYSLPAISGLVRKAAGDDADYEVSQRSTVFPRWLPLEYSRLPIGAFLCVSVRLGDKTDA